ncbi:MAG TPA: sulfur oxidation c-type cytochrome SoxX [Burkholderiaceae bacterium]|nr:sulfur oxidation c-type cytochrome SoxX [Burkholderiaceae bacterium]
MPTSIASIVRLAVVAVVAASLAGCASLPSAAELDQQAQAAIKASFRDQGIAKVDRLQQDLGQQACSAATPPSAETAKRIEADALASVRWPAAGRYLGDWREGEKLAQNGRGMTWTDASAAPKDNGAGCYNCHQIDKKEISFGTIGPSLWNYGKLRGVANPADPAAAAVVQYTWGKLWNSKAYAACSNMPRFGHMGLLDEDQLRHLMALLLDPASPVNQ